MAKRRLPIGIQTFRKGAEQDCYYVDKTPYIRRLLDQGTHYFLSRPRFGKSLLLDTLKVLFEANEPLFTGLHIHDTWDWSLRHPVVRLDFAGGSFRSPESARGRDAPIGEYRGRDGHSGPPGQRTGPLAPSACRCCTGRRGNRSRYWWTSMTSRYLDALEMPEVACANRDYLRGPVWHDQVE